MKMERKKEKKKEREEDGKKEKIKENLKEKKKGKRKNRSYIQIVIMSEKIKLNNYREHQKRTILIDIFYKNIE